MACCSRKSICPAACAARTGSNPCRSPPGCTRSASRGLPRTTTTSCAASRSKPGCSRRMCEEGYRGFEFTGRRAFEFFSDWIGPYSYEKLAHVEAAGINGGMESASAIMYGEKGVTAGACARRARSGAPVVGQRRHRARLGRRVAERGVRDVLHASVHGAVRRPRRLRAGAEGQHPDHHQDAGREPGRADRAPHARRT